MAYTQLPTQLLIAVVVILNVAHSESSLQQIHVLFRHGARTPSEAGLYPNDPYLNDTWYPDGLGALTKLGKQQGYKIGTALRAKYGEFLGNVYTSDIVESRTTSYDRTKITMSLLLAGLWPPAPVQQWNRELLWQPIPFNYVPYENDSLLGFPSWYCPEYAKEYENIVASDKVVNFLKTNQDMIDYINTHSGLNIKSTVEMYELYMGLYAEETAGKVLPEWTQKVYPDFLANVTQFEYKIQTDSNVLVKATGGPLVKKLINDARSKMDGQLNPSGRKLFLYSAHEYNIAYVLSALKMYELQIPCFASYVVIELHEIDNVYGFQIYYEDYTGNGPKLMTVQGCDKFCPFDRFTEIVKDILPEKE